MYIFQATHQDPAHPATGGGGQQGTRAGRRRESVSYILSAILKCQNQPHFVWYYGEKIF